MLKIMNDKISFLNVLNLFFIFVVTSASLESISSEADERSEGRGDIVLSAHLPEPNDKPNKSNSHKTLKMNKFNNTTLAKLTEEENQPLNKYVEDEEDQQLNKSVEDEEDQPLNKYVEDEEDQPLNKSVEDEEDQPLNKSVEDEEDQPLNKYVEDEEDQPLNKSVEDEEDQPLNKSVEDEEDQPLNKSVEDEEDQPLNKTVEDDEDEPLQKSEEDEKGGENVQDVDENQRLIISAGDLYLPFHAKLTGDGVDSPTVPIEISHEVKVEPSSSSESEESKRIAKEEEKRYLEELSHGNKAESYGSNPHYYQPDTYPELNRRFMTQFPNKEDDEISLVGEDSGPTNLEPKLATPDLVLAVAKESALLEASKPINPSEHFIQQKILRDGGNYWNAIWKEDVNPAALRSNSKKPLGVVQAKINPGSNLYDLVTKLKQISPRLLYVINKKVKY